MKSSIAVIVLTYNEELNLEKCLKSIAGLAREIFVVDSYSTDKTLEIAKRYSARIYQREFKNQADQFNWALDNLDIKSDWIFRLDADEYLTPELQKEIRNVLNNLTSSDDVSGFYMKRRVYFMGRWIRHGGYYPVWFLRLFRKNLGRSEEREIDEHVILNRGRAEYLENDFVDENKNGLKAWIAKHRNYALREAREVLAGNYGSGEKRSFYYKLPPFFRALLYWKYRYFIKLGFLDGIPGLVFHFLHGFWYRFLVDVKIYESRIKKL